MIKEIELPKDFTEFEGEELMSNFDGQIEQATADAIKGEKLFSRYAGWNFNGLVWWQEDTWNCAVYCYGSLNKIVSEESLEEIMETVSEEFGRD